MTTLAYQHFGGEYSETAALGNVLAYEGVLNPHNGQPFSEAMLLGIGGGIGAAYILFESRSTPSIYIGTRYHTGSGEFLQGITQRLGLSVAVKQTAGGKGAASSLQAALEQGQPAILSVDRASLPYQGFPPALIKYMEHTIVVYGLDEQADLAYIGDRAATPLTVTIGELAAARVAITAQKHRMMTIAPGSEVADLSTAINDGIHACTQAMIAPAMSNFSGNFGLNGLAKWADMITNRKDKKGWPSLLQSGAGLYNVLAWVFKYIETFDTPGSAFRPMYADFLDEASTIISKPALHEVAMQYRELGGMWHSLADVALPDAIAPFCETKELLARRGNLFAERGMAALPEIQQVEQRLAALKSQIAANFPLSDSEVSTLLGDLYQRVLLIHEAETQAITELQDAVA